MISMSVVEAFKAYEAVRHRLPPARQNLHTARNIESLEDIADDFDVFLLDAFGVLNIGETAIPGVNDRIDGFRAAGKRVLIVSNAASVPRAGLHEKYRRLGFDFPEADIVTSRAAMVAYMQNVNDKNWGIMLGEDTRLDDLGPLKMAPLSTDPALYAECDGFMLIGSGTWTEHQQSLLRDTLKANPRRVLVANPDIVAPREIGFSAEPGHFAHRLADETGITPEFFGKPFANIYDLAFRRLGEVAKSRTVMVGDSLHTDILGAQTAGIASVLISGYGFFAGQDTSDAIEASGIIPDYVATRP